MLEYAKKLPNSLFKENREKVLKMIKTSITDVPKDSIIIMKGKEDVSIDSTDVNYESIQESNFYYLFGVQEMRFVGCIEIDTGTTTLFAPKVPLETRISTNSMRKAEVTEKYELPAHYESMLEVFVESLNPVTKTKPSP